MRFIMLIPPTSHRALLGLSLILLSSWMTLAVTPVGAQDLQPISFKKVYHRPFYRHSYFVPIVTTTAIATAAAITTLTAGTGAPLAATGVSSIASWVAGGGAGSYMAGLSTIGGWFGGNAIMGAAILNATSAAVLGGAGSVNIAAPILTQTFIKSMEFGSYYLEIKEKSASILAFNFPVQVTDSIGTEVFKLDWNVLKALGEKLKNEEMTQAEYQRDSTALMEKWIKKQALSMQMEWKALNRLEREDFVARAIIIKQFTHRKDLFLDHIHYIADETIGADSFLLYLKAVAELEASSFRKEIAHAKAHYQKAKLYAEQALAVEPGILEVYMVLTIAHQGLDLFYPPIEPILERYSKNHYLSANKLYTLYALLGDLTYDSARYDRKISLDFYLKAWAEMSVFNTARDKSMLCMKIARSYKNLGEHELKDKYRKKAFKYIKDEEKIMLIKAELERLLTF